MSKESRQFVTQKMSPQKFALLHYGSTMAESYRFSYFDRLLFLQSTFLFLSSVIETYIHVKHDTDTKEKLRKIFFFFHIRNTKSASNIKNIMTYFSLPYFSRSHNF